ncbi:hypothetical protein KSS87_019693 [Heliosperma pusillum]|nr:hypothetical protein KSS87_019693 [Heliosperma pusillum]
MATFCLPLVFLGEGGEEGGEGGGEGGGVAMVKIQVLMSKCIFLKARVFCFLREAEYLRVYSILWSLGVFIFIKEMRI